MLTPQREISKFEKDCLLDWWVEECADQYTVAENKFEYEKWFDGLSFMEIDMIVENYV